MTAGSGLVAIWIDTISIQDFNEINLRMQNRPLEIVRKKQIASATDVKHRTGQFRELYIHKICNGIIFNETPCLHLHSEGVHLCEILVVIGLDHSSDIPGAGG